MYSNIVYLAVKKGNSFVNIYSIKVAQWATIVQLGASTTFRDTIVYDTQKAGHSELETPIRIKLKHSRY